MRPRTRATGIITCAALAAFAVTAAAGGVTTPPPTLAEGGIGEPQDDTLNSPVAPADGAIGINSGGTATGGTVPVRDQRRDGLSPAAAIRELRTAPKPPSIRVDASGRVRTVTAPAGNALNLPLKTPAGAAPETVATAFVDRYAPAFGLTAAHTTARASSSTMLGGDTVVRYDQYAGGLPVLGGQIVVTVNRHGVVGAAAEATGAAPVATKATVSGTAAARTAVTTAASRFKVDAGTLHAGTPKLWLYDPRLVDGPGPAQLRPTWQVSVHDSPGDAGHGVGDVYLDALTGKVTLLIEGHREAKNRLVCDLKNAAVDLNNRETYRCDDFAGGPAVARREGGAAVAVPANDKTRADINNVYNHLGTTYDFFKNKVGRDSFDGRGGQIKATVRACDRGPGYTDCPFENAFWEGTQFVFGAGLTLDDVTAHEFTHGVTEHTSNLMYWRQSGAINEALSDIFGQFVDLQTPADDAGIKHWEMGEDWPVYGALRDMATPSRYGQPDRYSSSLWDLTTGVTGAGDDSGGVHTNSGVANKAAQLLVSGGTLNSRTIQSIGTSELNAIDKSAALWYRVMNLLPSGADYRDLGATLSSACRALVGYQGFTATNCAQVDAAVSATEMDLVPDTQGHGAAEAPVCASPGQPISKVFYDGMERPSTRWARSNKVAWEYVPSRAIPYSYAAVGKGSLNGWTAPGVGGHTSTAELLAPLNIPSSGTTYLRFAHSLETNALGGGVLVQVNVGTGTQWTNLTAPSTGIPVNAGRIGGISTQGFGSTRFDVSEYHGKRLRVRFVVDAAQNQATDWYLDEFTVYQCETGVGQPRNLSARLDAAKTGGVLTWDAPQYAGPGIAGYEIIVTPAPAGGQNTYTTTAQTLTLSGLNPAVGYLVSVRAYDGGGAFGVSVPARLLSTPQPTGCVGACPPQPGGPPRPGTPGRPPR